MLPLSRTFAAWQFPFRFRTNDESLMRLVEWCFGDLPPADGPPFALSVERRPDDRYDLTLVHPDGTEEPCGAGRRGPALVELLCWEVNRRARATAAEGTVVHAAVLAGANGAVALCGESRSGKSTLTAAAARRGWRHLSDDLGLIDVQALTVAPYARPVMLREGGRRLLGVAPELPEGVERFFADDWFLPASALGAVAVHEPQPLVAIGLLSWGEPAAVEPLSRARTLHGLTLHSATLAHRGAAGFDDLVGLAEAVPGVQVSLGSADEVLDLLAPLVGAA